MWPALVVASLVGAIALGSPSVSNAQLPSVPGLGLGGSGGGKADVKGTEKTFNDMIALAAKATGALHKALGNGEKAAEALAIANDIASGKTTGANEVDKVQGLTSSVTADLNAKRAKGEKMNQEAGREASKAIVPFIGSFAKWKEVVDGIKNIQNDRMALAQASGMVSAAPKIPTAVTSQVEMVTAVNQYWSFSGIPTNDIPPPKSPLS